MQSIFVRHNCSSTPDVLGQLWARRLIALHYEDDFSTEPSDYSSAGRKALERLRRYCREGAIVGADYRRLNGAAMLVGNIEPGSSILAEEFHDAESGKSFIYKVVTLNKAVDVSYADYPLLAGIQPRQATITGWPSAEIVLSSALSGNPLLREPNCLHPSQLEVLCYEWLRNAGRLERLLMPIGRGLVDIDILGINESGDRTIAQVTYSRKADDLADKLRRLLRHSREADDIYFFLPREAPLTPDPRVKIITFRQVLDDLDGSEEVSIKRMLAELFAERRR